MSNGTTQTIRTPLGKVTDMCLRHAGGNKANVVLETSIGCRIQFPYQKGTELNYYRWFVGKDLFVEGNADGSHILLDGVCIATVRITLLESVLYRTAVDNVKRKSAEREQNRA